MLQSNFASWDTFMQSSIRVICIIFDLIFFSLKLNKKQRFQVRQLFQRLEYDMNQTLTVKLKKKYWQNSESATAFNLKEILHFF